MLLALASAGEVDVEDLDHWRAGTDAMLQGPEGCWRFAGGGRVTLAIYTPASAFTRAGSHEYVSKGTFTGILRDGVWEDLVFTETGEEGTSESEEGEGQVSVSLGGREERFDMKFEPSLLFGERKQKRHGGSSGNAAADSAVDTANVVDRIIASIDPAITTSYAQWDGDHTQVEFVQHVPLSDKARTKEVTLRTLFPEGDKATAVDVIFPRRIQISDLADDDDKPPFKIVLMDTQAHLRSQRIEDYVLPGAETVSAVVGVLGFTVGWEQRLVYHDTRQCTAAELAAKGNDGKGAAEGDDADAADGEAVDGEAATDETEAPDAEPTEAPAEETDAP
ncbi:MAG: hypothetical protein EP330_14880 [Deltaproteobacteria bacterium]|nr:MAG: hypothetical protein EP330_14880 [Deltaproteobacteria bacterium]